MAYSESNIHLEKSLETSLTNREIDKGHKKIMAEFDVARPDLRDFYDLYDPVTIKRDEKFVSDQEKKFSEKNESEYKGNKSHAEYDKARKQLSEIMEVLIGHYGEIAGWFGDESTIMRTTKYDDYKNGADLIIFFETDDEPIALSIDVTSASNFSDISEKINTCTVKATAKNKEATQIKYAKLPNDEVASLPSSIPLTIGFSQPTVIDLMRTVVTNQELIHKPSKNDLDKEKISVLKNQINNNPIQINMLQQIYIQLGYYIAVLEQRNQGNNQYLDQLKKVHENVEDIYFKKIKKIQPLENDPVHKKIIGIIEDKMKEINDK